MFTCFTHVHILVHQPSFWLTDHVWSQKKGHILKTMLDFSIVSYRGPFSKITLMKSFSMEVMIIGVLHWLRLANEFHAHIWLSKKKKRRETELTSKMVRTLTVDCEFFINKTKKVRLSDIMTSVIMERTKTSIIWEDSFEILKFAHHKIFLA